MRVAYLDIETDYVGALEPPELFRDFANHTITIVGIRVMDGDADDFVQLVGKDVTKTELLRIMKGVDKVVTYNGRSLPDAVKKSVGFDFPVIAAHTGLVLDREFEHVDLVPECWKKHLYGGLKKVEIQLGLQRKLPGKNGLWATETYRKFAKTGNKEYLDEVLAYNREDVFMLREVEIRLAKM